MAGQIGFIQAQGDNLYETLMLNLTLLRDSRECWGESKPCWELEAPKSAERTEICCPDNPAQLLTLQSRRLLLHRTGENVDGFCLLGGDFFPRENVFAEQMTIWRTMPIKKMNRWCLCPVVMTRLNNSGGSSRLSFVRTAGIARALYAGSKSCRKRD